jgi:hypothetical protein
LIISLSDSANSAKKFSVCSKFRVFIILLLSIDTNSG